MIPFEGQSLLCPHVIDIASCSLSWYHVEGILTLKGGQHDDETARQTGEKIRQVCLPNVTVYLIAGQSLFYVLFMTANLIPAESGYQLSFSWRRMVAACNLPLQPAWLWTPVRPVRLVPVLPYGIGA